MRFRTAPKPVQFTSNSHAIGSAKQNADNTSLVCLFGSYCVAVDTHPTNINNPPKAICRTTTNDPHPFACNTAPGDRGKHKHERILIKPKARRPTATTQLLAIPNNITCVHLKPHYIRPYRAVQSAKKQNRPTPVRLRPQSASAGLADQQVSSIDRRPPSVNSNRATQRPRLFLQDTSGPGGSD